MDFTIPQDSIGLQIDFTIKDEDGTVIVLTGYTITMKVWRKNETGTVLWSGACSIDDANAGTCHYTTVTGDFNIAGEFHMSHNLTKTGVDKWGQLYDLEVTERP